MESEEKEFLEKFPKKPRNAFTIFIDDLKIKLGPDVPKAQLARASLIDWSQLPKEAKYKYRDIAKEERRVYSNKIMDLMLPDKKARGRGEPKPRFIDQLVEMSRKKGIFSPEKSAVQLCWELAEKISN